MGLANMIELCVCVQGDAAFSQITLVLVICIINVVFCHFFC